MRSAGGTKSGEPCFVTRSTKVAIAFLVAVSFHDGRGSVTAVCASRETGRSIGRAARANIARRLTSKTLSLDVIIGSLCVSTLQPLHFPGPDDTSKPDIAGRCGDRLRVPRG